MQSKNILNQIPSDIAAVDDYISYAQARLSPQAWAYISGGSANEHTLSRNQSVYAEIKLLTSVLTDVSKGHTNIQLLGQSLAHPIMCAPVAYQKLAHPDGEIATAMAAQAQDALFVLSTLSSTSIEDIAQVSQGPKWFQLYFQNNKPQTLALVQRAEQANFSAIVVTVDSPINGLRNREQRSEFSLPTNVSAVNCDQLITPNPIQANESQVFQGFMAKAPSWDDIKWLKDNTDLPIIIKGIINPKDAKRAQQIGADGLVISNHGGRTLDTMPSPIEVLPAIRQITQNQIPLIVDSGIRRGSDIFKAIALGANAVMIGRPLMYALATAGALGAAHTIRLLRDELELTMALCGCETIADISTESIWP